MTDTTKEKFEAWARVNRLPINRIVNGKRYVSMETEWAWRAWVSKDAQLAAPVAAQEPKSPMLDEFLRLANEAGITHLPITFDEAAQPAQGERKWPLSDYYPGF